MVRWIGPDDDDRPLISASPFRDAVIGILTLLAIYGAAVMYFVLR